MIYRRSQKRLVKASLSNDDVTKSVKHINILQSYLYYNGNDDNSCQGVFLHELDLREMLENCNIALRWKC